MSGIVAVVGRTDIPTLLRCMKRSHPARDAQAAFAMLSNTHALRHYSGELTALEKTASNGAESYACGIGRIQAAPPTHDKVEGETKVAVTYSGVIQYPNQAQQKLQGFNDNAPLLARLVAYYLEQGLKPEEAVALMSSRLSGNFAMAVLIAREEHVVIAVQRGMPLAIGYGSQHVALGSSVDMITPLASCAAELHEGDIVKLDGEKASVFDKSLNPVKRPLRLIVRHTHEKQPPNRQMLQDIKEQPVVLRQLLARYINPQTKAFSLPGITQDLAAYNQINIIACGNSYFAGMIAKYWLEKLAGISATLDVASEFRYRNPPLKENGLCLIISQSGETVDTLAALRHIKKKKYPCITLVGNKDSSIAHHSQSILSTDVGPEGGKMTSKGFTAQLVAAACLAIAFAMKKEVRSQEECTGLLTQLEQLPQLIEQLLLLREKEIIRLADRLKPSRAMLFFGRGTVYPIALDGAMRIRRLACIPAEGMAAGELKHSALELVGHKTPTIALAPSSSLFGKTCCNIQEVVRKGGKVVILTDAAGALAFRDMRVELLILPDADPMIEPILHSVALQLLGYHIAAGQNDAGEKNRMSHHPITQMAET